MARGPDVADCSALRIHGAAVGSHQNRRFPIPEAYSLEERSTPRPVTPTPRSRAEGSSAFGFLVPGSVWAFRHQIRGCKFLAPVAFGAGRMQPT